MTDDALTHLTAEYKRRWKELTTRRERYRLTRAYHEAQRAIEAAAKLRADLERAYLERVAR